MTPADRANIWYHPDELVEMRTKVRIMVAHIKSSKREMISSLESAFDNILMFAESGLEEEDVKTLDNGSESLLSKDISSWSTNSMAGEACRGIEKTLIRRKRESASREARFLVVAADWSNGESSARLYRELSRYAAIYARCVAKADAAAVASVQEAKAEDFVVWRRNRFLSRDHIWRSQTC
jgi:urease alpha subunit